MPGIAEAAEQPTAAELSLRTSYYEEDNIPEGSVAFGSDQRYEIDIHQFHLLAPVADNWSFSLQAVREVMSGASPWGTVENPDGDVELIMSGATISDARNEYSLDVTRHFDGGSVSVGASHSTEDDYEANSGRASLNLQLNGKLTELSMGFSFSLDDIEPSDAELFGRVKDESKDSFSAFFGVTQVVNQRTLVQAGISGTRQSGFLSDPYKLRDHRGDERWQWALSSRLRRFVDSLSGAFHVDYRYYLDTFGVRSHTVDAAWHQDFGRIEVAPSIRWYAQREADFYLPVDNFLLPPERKQSSDFRMSTYGAISWGLKGTYLADRWRLSASVERYVSRESLSPFSGREEHPALVDFTIASIGWTLTI